MPVRITMPALSPTMEEGSLTKWFVKEGDKVNPGDVIAEIETDKATMEVEAVDEGMLAKIVVPAGTSGVKVNSVIALLTEENLDHESQEIARTPPEMPLETPVVIPQLDRARKDIRTFSSPLARRLAVQEGIDIALVNGTGPHGRILKRDVEVAMKMKRAVNNDVLSASQTLHDNASLRLFTPGEYEIVQNNSMRKTIARRLVESKQTVPHFYMVIDCELDELLKLRSGLNSVASMEKRSESVFAYKISVNDMIIKAVALALKLVPNANVSWHDGNTVRHVHSDIGVAVSINNGLITPIIRHADEKSLITISREMKELATRAREMRLRPEEYQGGTTAISNMGMLGVKAFSAIINPPQATIFAIGTGEERAVAKNGCLCVATMMTATISVDHRVIDGALAAELAQTFKSLIENPLTILA